VLQTAAEDGAAANSALHNVRSLFTAIIRSTDCDHNTRFIAHKDNLTAARIHGRVHYATKFGGEEPRAVYHYVGMIEAASFRDVREDTAFYLHTGSHTLA
jgi:hypothetical protein